jgi:hypothetical protein
MNVFFGGKMSLNENVKSDDEIFLVLVSCVELSGDDFSDKFPHKAIKKIFSNCLEI